jgi:hypothetical protein
MKVIENEVHVMFDVDDTLVMHGYDNSPNKIEVEDPYSETLITVVPHELHIKVLKDQRARGFYITVWSAGGYKWAEAVVKALKLEEYVDEVRTKPMKFVDDLEAGDVLGQRIYLTFKSEV